MLGHDEMVRRLGLALAALLLLTGPAAAERRVALVVGNQSGAAATVPVIDGCRDNPLQTSDKRWLRTARGLVQTQPRGIFSLCSSW